MLKNYNLAVQFYVMKKLLSFIFCLAFAFLGYSQLPKGFVYLKDIDPSIQIELRYNSSNNFIGKKIDGYNNAVLVVTKPTAEALKKIQLQLKPKQLSLKIFDGYRPQKAVNHFGNWAKNTNDTLMKPQYYPSVDKKNLFQLGYIATKSGHSRGSTIDLTLVDLRTKKEVDMGTPFDFFGHESWVNYSKITREQQNNRQLLQQIMISNGFRNYSKEWWHFTLNNEPFNNQYFDFNIE